MESGVLDVAGRMSVCLVWPGLVGYGMLCYDLVRVWYGMVVYGMLWYGTVEYDKVWYGTVCMYGRTYVYNII